MKSFLAAVLITVGMSSAQAQCNPYYTLEKGNEIEYTDFNAKGKKQGRSATTITNVTTAGNVFEYSGTTKMYDKKDKDITEMQYKMICEDGTLTFDMSKFVMNNSQSQEMEGFDISLEGDKMELPSDLSKGQKLRDLNFDVKFNFSDTDASNPMASATLSKMKFTITDRKVEDKLMVSTPAGDFECYKVSYTIVTKMRIMGIGKTINSKGVEYFTKGVGYVKSETFDKKGKLIGYSLMTKLKQ